ncbi:hypothetical protein BJX61DRAFT_541569 [Aspergillus egyptiacus]|nr:hypothetical protein BJX61DRAFT_541569 [Aspergillus egyptiacus]
MSSQHPSPTPKTAQITISNKSPSPDPDPDPETIPSAEPQVQSPSPSPTASTAASLQAQPPTPPREYPPESYLIAWIVTNPAQLTIARSMLTEIHTDLTIPFSSSSTDTPDTKIHYTLGSIHTKNLILVNTTIPSSPFPLDTPKSILLDMVQRFPHLRFGIMIGTAAGLPNYQGTGREIHDVRLGDVVVSYGVYSQSGRPVFPDVVFYDPDTLDIRANGGFFPGAPAALRMADCRAAVRQGVVGRVIEGVLRDVGASSNSAVFGAGDPETGWFERPDGSTDRLFRSTCVHGPVPWRHCLVDSTTTICDPGQEVDRSVAGRGDDDDSGGGRLPRVHAGPIATSVRVTNRAPVRDRFRAMYPHVLCLDREFMGVPRWFPCMAVRGVDGYADGHPYLGWKGYAKGVAAAYARVLVEAMSMDEVRNEAPAIEVLYMLQRLRGVVQGAGGRGEGGGGRCSYVRYIGLARRVGRAWGVSILYR